MRRNEPFARRLKDARLRKAAVLKAEGNGGYSQERLGIEAGIAEATASARMNQYEQGVHLPDLDMAKRFADALGVPLAYLFCVEDDLADLLLFVGQMSKKERDELLSDVKARLFSK